MVASSQRDNVRPMLSEPFNVGKMPLISMYEWVRRCQYANKNGIRRGFSRAIGDEVRGTTIAEDVSMVKLGGFSASIHKG
jgi:hypothetical protein